MISAVIVSHFRHGLRRIGRRTSEQMGCIVFCVVYGFCDSGLNIVDPCTAVILYGRQVEIVTGGINQRLRAVGCGSVVWFGDMLPPRIHFFAIGGEIVTATDRGQCGYDLASVFYCGCFDFHFVLCCVVAFAVSPSGDFVLRLGLVSGSCVHASQKGADHVFSVTLGNVTVPDWSCDPAALVCHQVDTDSAVSL